MNFFLSSRWSVRLALIIIALLALIALTSQWWLPYDPQAIDLPSRLHWLVSAISASRAIMISARRTDQREERKKFTRGLLHDDECAGPARR